MMSLTKKVFGICLLLDLVAFSVYGFVFWSIRSANEKARTLIAEASVDTEKNDTLQAIKLSLSENKDFIAQTDSFFVAADGVVPFINQLETLARESGVDLSISSVAVAPDSTNPKDFKEDLKLKLDMTGSWQNVFYFLSQLENQPYRVIFDDVTISLPADADIKFDTASSTKRTANETWKGTFDIEVLKLKQ